MQLDLLQEELIPASKDNQSAPPQKNKSTPRTHIAEDTKNIVLKPIPTLSQPSLDDFIMPVKAVIPLSTSANEVQEDKNIAGHDKPEKNPDAFKTISEAAKFLGVPQHVLRFWESRFAQIKPLKLAGGRRYYRPDDMEILSTIKNLLYKQGYTIKGAKQAFSSRKKPVPVAPLDILHQQIKPFPDVKQRVLTKKQQSQLSVIRQELIGLRETLALRLN